MEWEEALNLMEYRVLTDDETTEVCRVLRTTKDDLESQITTLTHERDEAVEAKEKANSIIGAIIEEVIHARNELHTSVPLWILEDIMEDYTPTGGEQDANR